MGQWESLDGITWNNSGCVAVSTSADRPSGWVDNNPASPLYGRQFEIFTDFAPSPDVTRVTRSTDNGATWSAVSLVTPAGATFVRGLRVVGSPGTDGTVFAAAMDEGGGGLNGSRRNFLYRSTDGGATWSAGISQGAGFLGAGRSVSGYFAGMYTTPVAGYWREMGWGDLGVGPSGILHYAYAARTAMPADPGNINYIRSTDFGFTWSTPLRLNTDATTRAQWSPSVSANSQGKVFISWYDERNTATDSLERFGRASINNGASWGADSAISDVVFPKPSQPDPNILETYVGTYNHAAFSNDGTGTIACHAWTDGRVLVNYNSQQNVFFDRIALSPVPLTSVVSRKIHGGAQFDIPLPTTGAAGVECRTGGATNNHTVVFIFTNTLTSVGDATVTSGTGSVSSKTIGADAHEYVVNLTGVTNQQVTTVTLTNVNDMLGNTTLSVSGSIAMLLGDTTASGSVNSSDISQTKAASGQPLTASNFRRDVTVSGAINSSDIGLVKSKSGTALP